MKHAGLYVPKLSPSPNSSKMHSRGASPAITRSNTQTEFKFIEDSFYFTNILKHINFSSFHMILEGVVDAYCNSFPYYSRVIKNFTKIKPVLKVLEIKKPKCNAECKCFKEEIYEDNSQINSKKLKLPSISILRTFLPNLSLVNRTIQYTKYPENIIILNFEGALGSYVKNELYIKPGVLNAIKKLSIYFQVILVTATVEEKIKTLLEYFEKLKIPLSGVYLRNEIQTNNKEINKLQDYSLVYSDFGIKNPEEEVLVIASHTYNDEINEINEEIISIKAGISVKINVERAPVPSEEYPDPPISILLPNYKINKSTQILLKLLRIIMYIKKLQKTDKRLNFRKILKKLKFSSIKSNAVHTVIIEHMQIKKNLFKKTIDVTKKQTSKHMQYCELHKKYTYQNSYKLTHNLFEIC